MGYKIPGRELPGEVATKRLCSVWMALGVALLEATDGAALAITPPSEELDLEKRKGALSSKGQQPTATEGAIRTKSSKEELSLSLFQLLSPEFILLKVRPKLKN